MIMMPVVAGGVLMILLASLSMSLGPRCNYRKWTWSRVDASSVPDNNRSRGTDWNWGAMLVSSWQDGWIDRLAESNNVEELLNLEKLSNDHTIRCRPLSIEECMSN